MGRILFPLIVGAAGVAVLVALGSWQVQRLAWKKAHLAEIESRIAAAPVAIPADPDPGEDLFLPVEVSGRLVGDPLRVLVSVKVYGAGHRLISVLETDTGRRLLVDRGYLRLQTETETPTGPVTIVGNLHWPQDADRFTPAPDGDQWFARDVAQMATVLNAEPVLVIAREVAPAEADITPLPVDTAGIPNDHLEYAITWFSLAAIWLLMTGYWVWRNRAKPKHSERP